MAGPQLGIKGVRGGNFCEALRESALRQCLADDNSEVLLPAKMDQCAHGVVERLHYLVTVLLPGRDDDPYRTPRRVHKLPVAGVEVPPLVQDGQAHHMPHRFDVADSLNLADPA